METKEYIVSLNKGVNYDEFWTEMENPTVGLSFVPDRKIDIINERVGSLRQCHYSLNEAEAKLLEKDPRVYSVEIPPNKRREIEFVSNLTQEGNFEKTFLSAGNYQNWGLKRCISETNNFGVEATASGGYEYTLNGEGVDVVITDSGVDYAHPEFTDANNNTRVQLIDWYDEAGLTTFSYRDLSTSIKSSVCSNSYINFQYDVTTYEFYDWRYLGSSLVLGAKTYRQGIQNDPSIKSLYENTEDSGHSYRLRYEGWVDYNFTTGPANLIWETKFTDDNKIQVLVVRHDDPIVATWAINGTGYSEPLLFLANSSFINGALQKSFVLSTEDNGSTWTVHGGVDTDYYVDWNGVSWDIVQGLAPELGSSGMTTIYTGEQDEANYNFNTPFPFYAGYGSNSPQTGLFYIDSNGHGTHVTGIAAGKTFGWAKESRIYSMKIAELLPLIDTSGISLFDGLDLIRIWHQNKPIDPKTGVPRPTILNASWGTRINYFSITGGNYRGTPWVDTNLHPEYGMVYFNHGFRSPSVDVLIQELIDAGIHVCIAAGNNSHKIDVEGGIDYNNYYHNSSIGIDIYYHQGSSPYDDQAINVGSMDSITFDQFTDQKSSFSSSGPGVDVYAPGSDIVSSCSYDNFYNGQPYYPFVGSIFEFLFKQVNLSGTSMASPQVCGLGALFLQLKPDATPAELKNYIIATSKPVLHSTGLDNDYTDFRSIHGGEPRILFNKFGVNYTFTFKIGKN